MTILGQDFALFPMGTAWENETQATRDLYIRMALSRLAPYGFDDARVYTEAETGAIASYVRALYSTGGAGDIDVPRFLQGALEITPRRAPPPIPLSVDDLSQMGVQGPQGPPGEQGPAGEQGAPGAPGVDGLGGNIRDSILGQFIADARAIPSTGGFIDMPEGRAVLDYDFFTGRVWVGDAIGNSGYFVFPVHTGITTAGALEVGELRSGNESYALELNRSSATQIFVRLRRTRDDAHLAFNINHLLGLSFRGERGDTGAAGEHGADGADGVDGARGPIGPQGIQGLTGPQGPEGPAASLGGQFMIWAEETGMLNDSLQSGWQWSFGNGGNGVGRGLKVGFDCVITGITLSSITTFTDADIIVTVDGANTPVRVFGTATNEASGFGFTHQVRRGDNINIKTISGSGGSQMIVGLAVESGGVRGPAGSDGADGADGADGSNGADGADGADGATGPRGPQGIEGPVGPEGPQGAVGPQGPQGEPGSGVRGFMLVAASQPGFDRGVNSGKTWTWGTGLSGRDEGLVSHFAGFITAISIAGPGNPPIVNGRLNVTINDQVRTPQLVYSHSGTGPNVATRTGLEIRVEVGDRIGLQTASGEGGINLIATLAFEL